jgi:hypothetical protein
LHPRESAAFARRTPICDIQRTSRGRDASYLAPPAQTRTCSFPAYGSHLLTIKHCGFTYARQHQDRASPALSPVRGRAGSHSPWSLPFAPPNSAAVTESGAAVFAGFPTRARLPRPCIIGYSSSLSRHGPKASSAVGQTWDLPASDAIRSRVMWPLTPAGRQHLA